MIEVRRRGERITFAVRVTPRASRTSVGGCRDAALLVRVTAAAAEGAANEAVVSAVARALDVAATELRIERGATSRTKTLSGPARIESALLRLAADEAKSGRARGRTGGG